MLQKMLEMKLKTLSYKCYCIANSTQIIVVGVICISASLVRLAAMVFSEGVILDQLRWSLQGFLFVFEFYNFLNFTSRNTFIFIEELF